MLMTACGGELLSEISLPDVTAPEVTVPDATVPDVTVPEVTAPEAEAPAAAPDEGADDGEAVPLWAWIVIGLVAIGLVSWIGARAGSRNTSASASPAVAQPDWKAAAQTGYADARWLYDQLTPSLAMWKGDNQYAIQTGSGSSYSDRNAVWSEADGRLQSARDSLYRVESLEAQSPIGTAARELVTSLNSVREGVDRLAAAQLDSHADGSDQAVSAATDDLNSRRSGLQAALSRFSAQI